MNQNASQTNFTGTGRRKNAVARIAILPGSGRVIVNAKTIDEFFGGLERHKKVAMKPIEVFTAGKTSYDYVANVNGGGVTGQAGAISQGIARALLKLDPALKQALRKEGLLTRDSRMVERKKPGRPKARKRFQFSKR
jgi:small subunit ribosomal protein S9